VTTPKDRLFDALRDAAAAYLLEHGISTGVDRLASAMKEAAGDTLEDIRDEATADVASPLAAKMTAFQSQLDSFDRILRAEQMRIAMLIAGNAPLGTEPQS
jgi:hypothetical protein